MALILFLPKHPDQIRTGTIFNMRRRSLAGRVIVLALILTPCGWADEASWRKLTDDAYAIYMQDQPGHVEEGIRLTREALDLAQREFGAESLEAAESMGNLGALYRRQGAVDAGKQLIERARSIRSARGITGTHIGLELRIEDEFMAESYAESVKQARARGEHPVQRMALATDFDGDGDCDDQDRAMFRKIFDSCVGDTNTANGCNWAADFNLDGRVNEQDRRAFEQSCVGTAPLKP